MKSSLARMYLMQALAMERTNEPEIKARVLACQCIIPDCGRELGSRGLCDHHRQMWYRQLNKQSGEAEKVAFEEKSVELGLILRSGEQDEWIRAENNPFKAVKAS